MFFTEKLNPPKITNYSFKRLSEDYNMEIHWKKPANDSHNLMYEIKINDDKPVSNKWGLSLSQQANCDVGYRSGMHGNKYQCEHIQWVICISKMLHVWNYGLSCGISILTRYRKWGEATCLHNLYSGWNSRAEGREISCAKHWLDPKIHCTDESEKTRWWDPLEWLEWTSRWDWWILSELLCQTATRDAVISCIMKR